MITQEYLKQRLHYDPDTGVFTWESCPLRSRYWNSRYACSAAGTKTDMGYIHILLDRKIYKAHRLAWFYIYGEWPNDQIDHIDHLRDNNRLSNLRSVTVIDNHKNHSMSKANTSGHTGVGFIKKSSKWCATIHASGEAINLGYFSEISDAIEARKNAEIRYGFHDNHGKCIAQ